MSTLFAISTFLIDWVGANKEPIHFKLNLLKKHINGNSASTVMGPIYELSSATVVMRPIYELKSVVTVMRPIYELFSIVTVMRPIEEVISATAAMRSINEINLIRCIIKIIIIMC